MNLYNEYQPSIFDGWYFLCKIRNQMENIIYRRIYLRKAVEYYRTYKSRKSKDI